jgi:hypothetical protein
MVLMEGTTSLLSHDSQSLIVKTHILRLSPHRQCSYYVIDVIGVLHIFVTLEYLQIIFVHNAIQTAMNWLAFLLHQMSHLFLIIART